jgi:hypothetical protein
MEDQTRITVKPPMIALRDHPRASLSIRRAKARGGLGGFALGALGSWTAGGDPFTIGLHALVTGIAAYMAVWAISVTVWRQLLLAEVRATVARVVETRRAEAERLRREHELRNAGA